MTKQERQKAQAELLDKEIEAISVSMNQKTEEEILAALREIDDLLLELPWVQNIYEDKYGEELKRRVCDECVVLGNDEYKDKEMVAYYLEKGYDKYSMFYDEPYLDDRGRGSFVNLLNQAKCILEDDECGDITVLTNRTNRMKIKIPARQAARDLLEWCVRNKVKGFYYDW